jgi:hypothetical protein
MSDRSSAELERDAEAARDKVADTAQSIREKLTAGQMIDEFADMITGGDLSGSLSTLKSQARENPLPVILVGAGIAWLAFGKGVTDQQSQYSHLHSTARPARPQGVDTAARPGSGSMASSVIEGAKTAAQSVTETVSGMTDSLSAAADGLRPSMLTGSSRLPRNIQRSAAELAEQEPLWIAALGLAFGAVAGAMLPASELEKEQIGPHAERLREEAKEMIDRGMDSASRVAAKSYDALKEEADRQGLAPGKSTVAERVGKVVKSTAQSAGEAAREELGTETEDDDQKT